MLFAISWSMVWLLAGAAEIAPPLHVPAGALDPRLLPPAVGDDTARIRLVQAQGSARDLAAWLERQGAKVLSYYSEQALVVRVPPTVRPELIPGVRWQGALRPAWKRSPRFSRPTHEDRVRIWAWPGVSLRPRLGELAAQGELLGFSDDSAGTGHAVLRLPAGRRETALERLGEIEEVAWLEPYREVVFCNDDSAWVIQSGDAAGKTTPLFARGLSGFGQIIAVADSGLDTDACQFRLSADAAAQTRYNTTQPPDAQVTDAGNKVLAYYLLSGASAYDDRSKLAHGTHVAGCAAGDNFATLASGSLAGRDHGDGMAPGARLVIQDIGRRDGNQAGLPDSLVDLYRQAYDSGARIHNNSYGYPDPDVSYGGNSREVDEAAWRMPELLIVWSAGNLGPDPRTLDGMGATAKNSLTVGGSLAGASRGGEGVCAFSSQGPAGDGRLKPELVAPGAVKSALETAWVAQPGTDIYGQPQADTTTDPPNDNCAVDSGYRVGTSFAAPLVAGAAALSRQYFMEGFYPSGRRTPAEGFVPSAALLKAVLLAAAESIDGPLYDTSTGPRLADLEPAPTPVQGLGLPHLDRALFFDGDAESLAVLTDTWSDGVDRGAARKLPLSEGQSHAFLLRAVRPGTPLRLSLAWTDPPAAAGAGSALVNDLDLVVEDDRGVLYRGNVNFENNRNAPAGAAAPDGTNPHEILILDVAEAGDLHVRVTGRRVPGNGMTSPYRSDRQGYALLAVGDFAEACDQDPCPGSDGGVPDGADAQDGQDGPDTLADGDDGSGDGAFSPDADGAAPDEGDPASGDDGGAKTEGNSVEGGCACGGAGPQLALAALVPLAWRRRHGARG